MRQFICIWPQSVSKKARFWQCERLGQSTKQWSPNNVIPFRIDSLPCSSAFTYAPYFSYYYRLRYDAKFIRIRNLTLRVLTHVITITVNSFLCCFINFGLGSRTGHKAHHPVRERLGFHGGEDYALFCSCPETSKICLGQLSVTHAIITILKPKLSVLCVALMFHK